MRITDIQVAQEEHSMEGFLEHDDLDTISLIWFGGIAAEKNTNKYATSSSTKPT
jgi:hypothetical protein